MCNRFKPTGDPNVPYLPIPLDMYDWDSSEIKSMTKVYNLAPTDLAPAVIRCIEEIDGEKVSINHGALVHWQFVPEWVTDITSFTKKYSSFNARSEKIEKSPMFKNAFRERRCLVLAEGFYEWRMIPGEKYKQPMYIKSITKTMTAFAGIWEYNDSIGEKILAIDLYNPAEKDRAAFTLLPRDRNTSFI